MWFLVWIHLQVWKDSVNQKLVHLFKEQDFIEDNYKIISNGHYYFTKEFNTYNISEGFVIYEKLSI